MSKTHLGRKTWQITGHYRGKRKRVIFNVYAYDREGAINTARKRGYVVKSGFKFGAHFRVYDRGQVPGKDHSNFLVHGISEGKTFSFPEVSRAVRLAHSVRKRFIYAIVDDDGSLTYYKLLRAKL